MKQKLLKIVVCMILMVSVFLSQTFISQAASSDYMDVTVLAPSVQTLGEYVVNEGSLTYVYKDYRLIVPFYFQDSSYRPYAEGRLRVLTSFNVRLNKTAASSSVGTSANIYDWGILGFDSMYYNMSFPSIPKPSFSYSYNGSSYTEQTFSTDLVFDVNFFDLPISQSSLSTDYCYFYFDFHLVPNGTLSNMLHYLSAGSSSTVREQFVYSSNSKLYSDSAPIVSASNSNANRIIQNQQSIADSQAKQEKEIADAWSAQSRAQLKEQTENDWQLNNDLKLKLQDIENSRSQQDKLQHDEQLRGYDTSGVDSVQQVQQDQLDAYQDQQDQVINNAYDQIGSFTDDAFSTTSISAYATSFAFVGLLFNKLWSSFGNFTAVLVLMLSLGVAGFILQIRKGG